MTRWFKTIGKFFFWCCLLLMAGWATLAILYSNLPISLRPWLAGSFGIISLVFLFWKFNSPRAQLGFLCIWVVVLVWWFSIPPDNDRDWQPDLAVLAWAEIAGDNITLHNIRNCDYQTETDFTCNYYDRNVDLSKLRHVDFFLVYWGSPSIAHTMMSFEFEGQGIVSFSIETRKEKGENYSTIKGFFRQYEIFYVVADERDVVRLRTNYREGGKGEEVYLYRMTADPEVARKVFLSYLRETNRLKEQPEWYNALTDNCTTSILRHTMPYNPKARFDWRLIANGYIDEMLYERGSIDTRLPFTELKKRSYINPIAQAANKDLAFSQRIRVQLLTKEAR